MALHRINLETPIPVHSSNHSYSEAAGLILDGGRANPLTVGEHDLSPLHSGYDVVPATLILKVLDINNAATRLTVTDEQIMLAKDRVTGKDFVRPTLRIPQDADLYTVLSYYRRNVHRVGRLHLFDIIFRDDTDEVAKPSTTLIMGRDVTRQNTKLYAGHFA